MERRTSSTLNAQVYQQAAEWFVEFRTAEPDQHARGAFHAWLQESPAHVRAYLETAAIWNEVPSLGPRDHWTIEALISAARGEEANVVPLQDVGASPSVPRGRQTGRMLGKTVKAAFGELRMAAAFLIVAAGIMVWWQSQRDLYTTGIGEQRSIALPDGSMLDLNSRSRVKVRFSADERAVELLRGQALFSVAKDPGRPFVVSSGATRVRAVGTQFDVYRKKSGTLVTVLEGQVVIQAPGAAPALATVQQQRAPMRGASPPTLLSAGEQVTVTSTSIRPSSNPNIALATGWTERKLVFASTPLAEVAEEFNRYNHRQLTIEGAGLERLEIDGVFASTEPAALIRFLKSLKGVQVVETDAEIRIVQQRPSSARDGGAE